MGKLVKSLLVVVAVLLVILGGATFYLTSVFDPNDYKSTIQAAAKEQANLDLAIGGDLSLSVFPWLGIDVSDVQLNHAGDELASLGTARVHAKLMPLLKGEMEIDAIEIDGLQLSMVIDAQGQANWSTVGPAAQQQSDSTPAPNATNSAALLPLAALMVGEISIRDSQIRYLNRQTQADYQIAIEQLQTRNVALEQSFPISLAATLTDNLAGTQLPIALNTQVTLSQTNQTLQLSDLALAIAGIKLTGHLSAEGLDQAPTITADLVLEQFSPSDLAQPLNLPALAPMTLPIQGELAFRFSDQQLSITNLAINTAAGDINSQGTLTLTPQGNPIAGTISSTPIDLRKLLAGLNIEPPATANKDALKQLTLSTQVTGNGNNLLLKQLQVKLDNTQLTGTVGLADIEQQRFLIDLNVDQINLDDYLPRTAAADSAETKPAKQSVKTEEALLLPVAALRAINADAALKVSKLTANKIDLADLRFIATSNGGVINIKEASSQLYGGEVKANGTIDARTDTPKIQLTQSVKQVQAAPVLKALADIDYIQGALDLDLTATARGATKDQLTRTLKGQGNYAVTSGQLTNIDLERLVCEGIAKIRNRELPAVDEAAVEITHFQTFDGRFNIADGQLQTPGMNIGLRNLFARGSGAVNMLDKTLDYRLDATVKGNQDNRACQVHERYRDVAWPLRCQGSLDTNPGRLCQLDRDGLEKIIAQLARKEIRRKAGDEIDDKLREKLGDEGADLLKGILGL